MSETSIALNRFGLGGRSGNDPGPDPRQWLLGQLGRFEVRPKAAGSLAPSGQIVGELSTYQLTLLDLQRVEREKPPSPPSSEMSAKPSVSKDADSNYSQNAGNDPVNLHRRNGRLQARTHYGLAVTARTATAVTGNAPFVERLTHFWANHFAVSADKLEVLALGGSLEFEAIRPHVLGKFRDMLFAVEQHPAMLLYLDQAQSVGANSEMAQRAPHGVKLGLNENLAREILELHTLGVRTGYTQSDVTEFARALTGWTVTGLSVGRGGAFGSGTDQPKGFFFSTFLHEPGTRTILGKSYNDFGERQATAVLEMLATHPATANHIATKLARHFAGDDPPAPLVSRLAAAFLKSDGDLPTLYRVLVNSPECWVKTPVKFKSPWEWAVSALRALDTQQILAGDTVSLFAQLGQPVWRPGSPAGWDDVASAWVGPDAIMRRVEAAQRMVQRQGGQMDARARAVELFPGALSEPTRRTIAAAGNPTEALALMLVTPEFMRR
ncbi:MAG: DUF1800 domain-containing protein [Acidobacteriota bacterium]